MKFTPYSFSKISTFNSCPRKFKYQYIDKIGDVVMDTPALIRGRTVHYLLENSKLSYSEYTDNIKKNLKLYPECLDILNNFKNSELGQKYLNLNAVNEFRFGLTEQLEPNTYKRTNLFNGIIDYVCRDENKIYIIDFKTGKYKEERFQDYNQLLFYAIYFFLRYENLNDIEISFVYVEHLLENNMILKREYLNSYLKQFLTNIQKIEKENSFNKNITKLCDYCPFQDLCK